MNRKPYTRLSRAWLITLTSIGLAGLPSLAQCAYAQQGQNINGVEVMHIKGPIFMFSAGGSNITASIGPDGVLLVDTGPAEMADKLKAAIVEVQQQVAMARALTTAPPIGGAETRSATQAMLFTYNTPKRSADPIRFIMNTSGLPDHVGGNAKVAKAIPKELSFQDPQEDATHIYAHENVLGRLSGAKGDEFMVPFASRPSDTYVANLYKLTGFFNGEGVQLNHVPSASTDGDSIVWFRGSDVIAAGDIYRTDAYPTPDIKMGGNIQGVIEGLNQLLDMAIPEYRQEGGTLIVPGHGRLSDFADVAWYRDMVTIIRDRVQHLIEKGMSLEQVQAAKPTRDYDGRYGKQPGSADKFIDAVYRSLSSRGDK
jgi:glyoxylase-like metal-dependent hydrolase (beta-lactamase superfamily II)